MRRIAILDTETQGLDPHVHQCLEVAVIVYDIKEAAPVSYYSSLMFADSNAAEETNGISVSLLLQAPPPEIVWNRVYELVKQCDAIVAHRVEFDRSFCPDDFHKMNWVCSKFDLVWPKSKTMGEHLLFLALKHDVGVVHVHRAMSDVDILARLFTRAAELGTDLEAMLLRGMRPKKRFVVDVSYNDRDKAKDQGFAWNGDRKQWYRSMPPEDVDDLKKVLPFPIRQID